MPSGGFTVGLRVPIGVRDNDVAIGVGFTAISLNGIDAAGGGGDVGHTSVVAAEFHPERFLLAQRKTRHVQHIYGKKIFSSHIYPDLRPGPYSEHQNGRSLRGLLQKHDTSRAFWLILAYI